MDSVCVCLRKIIMPRDRLTAKNILKRCLHHWKDDHHGCRRDTMNTSAREIDQVSIITQISLIMLTIQRKVRCPRSITLCWIHNSSKILTSDLLSIYAAHQLSKPDKDLAVSELISTAEYLCFKYPRRAWHNKKNRKRQIEQTQFDSIVFDQSGCLLLEVLRRKMNPWVRYINLTSIVHFLSELPVSHKTTAS